MKNFLLLLFLFTITSCIFGNQIQPLPDLINPDGIYVSKDRLYITEKTKITIYSLEHFHLLKTFGREGEGPQEFKDKILYIYFRDDNLIINSMGKVSTFTKNGDFIKEKRLKASRSGDYCPIKNKFVGIQFKAENKSFYQTLNIFDSQMNKIKEIARIEDDFQPGKGMRVFIEPQSYSVLQDRIFVTFNVDFIITAFNANGEELFSIKENYPRLPLAETYKNAVDTYFRTDHYYKQYYERIKKNIIFPSHLPAIRYFITSRQKIYVGTYKRVDRKTEFYIFSGTGKLLKKTVIKIEEPEKFLYNAPILFSFENNHLYQLVENQDENWELHVTPIN